MVQGDGAGGLLHSCTHIDVWYMYMCVYAMYGRVTEDGVCMKRKATRVCATAMSVCSRGGCDAVHARNLPRLARTHHTPHSPTTVYPAARRSRSSVATSRGPTCEEGNITRVQRLGRQLWWATGMQAQQPAHRATMERQGKQQANKRQR